MILKWHWKNNMTYDLFWLNLQTSANLQEVERMCKRYDAYMHDYDNQIRLKQRKCAFCYNFRSGGITLQGFQDYKCKGCNVDKTHTNSDIPRFCSECSLTYDVCIRCGADINLKDRKVLIKKNKK